MRSLIIAGLALALVGCASTPTTQIDTGKGIAAGWAALDAVAVTLDGLATSHVLTGANAKTAATDLTLASKALTDATAAYKAGNGATAAQNVATATALVTELVQLAANPKGS